MVLFALHPFGTKKGVIRGEVKGGDQINLIPPHVDVTRSDYHLLIRPETTL